MRRLVLLLPLVAACHRGPAHCAPGTRSSLELRNGAGALTLALKDRDLCDGQLRWVGSVDARPGAPVTLRDTAGRLRLELTRESSAAATGRDRAGPHLRLYRDSRELRVLRVDGVPLGSVVPEGSAATIFTPSSQPLARVALRPPDAVVTDLGGSAQVYVVPAGDPGAAGVFAIPGVDAAEAVAIYLYWSRL